MKKRYDESDVFGVHFSFFAHNMMFAHILLKMHFSEKAVLSPDSNSSQKVTSNALVDA